MLATYHLPEKINPKSTAFRKKLLYFLSSATSTENTADKDENNSQYSC